MYPPAGRSGACCVLMMVKEACASQCLYKESVVMTAEEVAAVQYVVQQQACLLPLDCPAIHSQDSWYAPRTSAVGTNRNARLQATTMHASCRGCGLITWFVQPRVQALPT